MQLTPQDLTEVVKFGIPLLGAAFAWLWNERRRRVADEYQRKEQKYTVLIEAAQGFYEHVRNDAASIVLKNKFLAELNKCWLYCPDDVILAANSWLALLMTGANSSNAERKQAQGELMVAIRRDMLSRRPVKRTNLRPEDFKHLRVN